MTLTNFEFAQIAEFMFLKDKSGGMPHVEKYVIAQDFGNDLKTYYLKNNEDLFSEDPLLLEKLKAAHRDYYLNLRLKTHLYGVPFTNKIPAFAYHSKVFLTIFELKNRQVFIYIEPDSNNTVARQMSSDSGIKIVLSSDLEALKKKEKQLKKKGRSKKKILNTLRRDLSEQDKINKELQLQKEAEEKKILELIKQQEEEEKERLRKKQLFSKGKDLLIKYGFFLKVNNLVRNVLISLLNTVRENNLIKIKIKKEKKEFIKNECIIVFKRLSKLKKLQTCCRVMEFFRGLSKKYAKIEHDIIEAEKNQISIAKEMLDESFNKVEYTKIDSYQHKLLERKKMKCSLKNKNYTDIDDTSKFWFGFRKTSTLMSLFYAYNLNVNILKTDYSKLQINSLEFMMIKKAIFILSKALNTKHFLRFCNVYAGNFDKDTVGALVSKLLIGEEYDLQNMIEYINWFSNVFNNKINYYVINHLEKVQTDYEAYQQIIKCT